MKNNISVIVPVYNVARYLPECLESIIGQTYKQLEIILIDDGSTDESGKICDDYANKDSRITVIHQKNGGAASAKNAGLRVASGEYLSFVDSDDYLERDAYEYMISQLRAYDADVVQCAFKKVYVNGEIEYIKWKEAEVYDAKQYLHRYTIDWTCGLLWDKLYRRNVFAGVCFEEGHKIDDEFFTYQGIINAKKIVHIPKIIYNYRKRKSSVMLSTESQQKIIFDKLEYLEMRRKKVLSVFPDLKQDFDYNYLSMLVLLSKNYGITEAGIKKIKYLIKNYFSERNSCKMSFSLRKQLFRIQYTRWEKLMPYLRGEEVLNEPYECFE